MYSPLDILGLIFGIAGLSGTIMLVRYLFSKHRIVSAERAYATAYTLYLCSVSEGLLLPDEKTKLRHGLRRVRMQLNSVKNDMMCMGSTWCQVILTLFNIYRCLRTIDRTLQSISTEIASTSRKGRERLATDGIPYEPCMFPLAATISHYLESFKRADASDIHQLFPSQEDIPRCTTPENFHLAQSTSCSEDNEQSSFSSSHLTKIPEHRDSMLSTATTVVEDENAHGLNADTAGICTHPSPIYSAISPEKDEGNINPADPPSLFRMLPFPPSKEIDPGLALSDFCMDLQSRMGLLQSILKLPQTPESSSALASDQTDLERCKADLLVVVGHLSKVPDIWSRRQTGPVLPI